MGGKLSGVVISFQAEEPKISHATDGVARDILRGKLPLMIEREGWVSRVVWGCAVAAVLVGFWAFTRQFWVAAHPGMDQNAYLVSGKLFARQLGPGLKVDDPYQFVGSMWVSNGDGRYYAKYPLGLPVVYGVVVAVGGVGAAYYVSPL